MHTYACLGTIFINNESWNYKFGLAVLNNASKMVRLISYDNRINRIRHRSIIRSTGKGRTMT